MASIVSMSEAASIAIHSVVLIANSKDYVSVTNIAETLHSSKHHVAKVMQRLTKSGYVKSFRGPTGGFILNKKPEDIKFIDIYEEIEGKLIVSHCPFQNNECKFKDCIFKCVTGEMTRMFKEYMDKETVAMHLNN